LNIRKSNPEQTGLAFRCIKNFRDTGGAPTVDGKSIKQGIIFRSANPDKLSRKDLRRLYDLNIRTIIDLRAPYESKNHNKKIDAIDKLSMPLDFEQRTREKLMPYLYKRDSYDIIDEISNSLYIEILDAAVMVFRQVIEVLLSPERCPVLIHCQAGKDRTGIICALIQLALEAERESIISDYMKSNEALLPFFRKILLVRKILSLGFFPSNNILYAITVRQRNIESVLDRVNNHYGGIAGYLGPSGPGLQEITRLRKILVTN
jgi:protein-tyrosine phosphatase